MFRKWVGKKKKKSEKGGGVRRLIMYLLSHQNRSGMEGVFSNFRGSENLDD